MLVQFMCSSTIDPMSVSAHKKRRSEPMIPTSAAGFKQSDQFVLESQLTSYDYLPPNIDAVGLFQGSVPFYERRHVVHLRSASQWKNKFNRSIREGERPMRVISRDVAGVQRTVELFSEIQTEPWRNVIASEELGIPTNEYGNVESDRIPENAVLIPCPDMTLAVQVCKAMKHLAWCRCQSGWKRKSPVYVGIVVLAKDRESVLNAINDANLREREKEKSAQDAASLTLWRLLIRRMQAEWYIKSVVDR